jgi:hypothetical protein
MIKTYYLKCTRHTVSLPECILRGAGTASIIILITFLVNEYNMNLIRILFVIGFVTTAGGFGGTMFYITDSLRNIGGFYKSVANFLSIIVYCFILAGGFIFSMNGHT